MKEADVFPDIGWLDNNLFCGHGRADSWKKKLTSAEFEKWRDFALTKPHLFLHTIISQNNSFCS